MTHLYSVPWSSGGGFLFVGRSALEVVGFVEARLGVSVEEKDVSSLDDKEDVCLRNAAGVAETLPAGEWARRLGHEVPNVVACYSKRKEKRSEDAMSAERRYRRPELSDMVGLTMTDVRRDGDLLSFKVSDGRVFKLYSDIEGDERVYIEDVCGDLADLEGTPILMAEEVSNDEVGFTMPTERCPDRQSSETWTFYKFATVKGCVTVRWYGTSSGYYSEKAAFRVSNQ